MPDPERRLPIEFIESSPSLPRPFLEDLGCHQDVANPIPDSKRRCPLETVPLTNKAPTPAGKDSRSENGDVSNLRLDSKRRCFQEILPSFPDALLPTSGETNLHPAKMRHTARELTPPRRSQFTKIITPLLDHLLQTLGKEVGLQTTKTADRRRRHPGHPDKLFPDRNHYAATGISVL